MEKMYPKDVNPVTKQLEWLKMKYPMLVDPGAADTMMPSDWFEDHELIEGEGVRLGAYYVTANGGCIRNEGERKLTMCTGEGQLRQMTCQVVKTKKALASASKICENGNTVVFDEEESYIYSKATGERTMLRLENGVYLLDVAIAPPKWKPEQGIPSTAIESVRGGGMSTAPFGGPAK